MRTAAEHWCRIVRQDGGGFVVYCDECGVYLGRYVAYDSAYSAAREHERATGEEVSYEQNEAPPAA